MASKEYQNLRSAIIRKGKSLHRWAKDNGLPVSTVYGAASGERSGVEAVKIKTKLEEFINAK